MIVEFMLKASFRDGYSSVMRNINRREDLKRVFIVRCFGNLYQGQKRELSYPMYSTGDEPTSYWSWRMKKATLLEAQKRKTEMNITPFGVH